MIEIDKSILNDNKKQRCLTIFTDENIEAGYIHLFKMKGKDSIYWLEYFVKEEHRKKGLIKKFLPKVFELCKQEGITRVMAQVKKDNNISNHIMIKQDFIKVGEFQDVNIYARSLDNDVNVIFKEVISKHLLGR